MYSRRTVFAGAAAFALVASNNARAQDACVVFSKDRQSEIAPEAALRLLKDGNERFTSGKTINCDLRTQVRASFHGQAPFAAVVGCIDSRVPPELVFDQRLGAIFAARVAGNFVNTDILGSLEFACKISGAKAVVVLGHSDCGAIKGAIDEVKMGNLTAMLKNFEPAMAATTIKALKTSQDKKLVQAVATTHAKLTAKQILERSPILKEMADKKEILVAAAMHDLETGKVSFLD